LAIGGVRVAFEAFFAGARTAVLATAFDVWRGWRWPLEFGQTLSSAE
jgi:hypothetical protein